MQEMAGHADIIFQYMQENMEEHPKTIIILINGYARIPDEKEVDRMSVLWLIIDCVMEPDWGNVYIFIRR